jgi:Protein of unknown function (DUF3892)
MEDRERNQATDSGNGFLIRPRKGIPPTRLEVTCINRTDWHNGHERIKNIGGKIGPKVWKNSVEFVMDWIEDGTFAYFVNQGGHQVDIIIAMKADGHKYLKTKADGEQPNSLLSLPECP